MDPSHFIEKWRNSGASERANKDSFLVDLCDVLNVPHPDPATGDPERDRYVFERDAVLIHGGERHTVGKIDLYKHACFIVEAKQGSERDSKKLGTARRGTAAWNVAMQEAYGQALQYASTIEPPPPFLIITDIGYCFDLYASFDGSRRYRKFPDAGIATVLGSNSNDIAPAPNPVCLLHSTSASDGHVNAIAVVAAPCRSRGDTRMSSEMVSA